MNLHASHPAWVDLLVAVVLPCLALGLYGVFVSKTVEPLFIGPIVLVLAPFGWFQLILQGSLLILAVLLLLLPAGGLMVARLPSVARVPLLICCVCGLVWLAIPSGIYIA